MKKCKKEMTEQEVKARIKSTLNQIIIASLGLNDGPVMCVCEEVEIFAEKVKKIFVENTPKPKAKK